MPKFYLEIELQDLKCCSKFHNQSCPAFDDEYSECKAMNGKRLDYDTNIYGHKRPEWCPLKQLKPSASDPFGLWKGKME